MKIELDVNPGELSKSVVDIINNLTPEQKVDIARQTMEKWLREPYDIERQAKEREVVAALIANRPSYRERETEEQIRKGYDFQQAMRDFQSTKEIMIKQITQAITEMYKSEVKKVVETDPKIQAMKDEVIATIKEKFPETANKAMMLWMASSMAAMFDTTMGIKQFAESVEQDRKNLSDRISQVEVKVAGRF